MANSWYLLVVNRAKKIFNPRTQTVTVPDSVCNQETDFIPETYVNRFPVKNYFRKKLLTVKVWGVKHGEKVVVNIDHCSIFDAMREALKYPYAEVFCDTLMNFYQNGDILFEGIDQKRFLYYNIDWVSKDWILVDYDKAITLFPDLAKRLNLRSEKYQIDKKFYRFLVSPDFENIILAASACNPHKHIFNVDIERACSFKETLKNYENSRIEDCRKIFEDCVEKIEQGYAGKWIKQKNLYERFLINIDEINNSDKYEFLIGYPDLYYQEAIKIVQNPIELKRIFANSYSPFTLLFDGNFPEEGQDLKLNRIVVPYEIYQAWTRPFTEKERAFVNRTRFFCYTRPEDIKYCKGLKLMKSEDNEVLYRLNFDLDRLNIPPLPFCYL